MLVVCIIICSAGIIQELEACDSTVDPDIPCQDLSYIDAAYFIVVTVSTLGYGDVSPVTYGGKLITMLSIICTTVAIPLQVSGLTTELSKRSEYESQLHNVQQHEHVVVCGEITSAMIWNFVKEVRWMLLRRKLRM